MQDRPHNRRCPKCDCTDIRWVQTVSELWDFEEDEDGNIELTTIADSWVENIIDPMFYCCRCDISFEIK